MGRSFNLRLAAVVLALLWGGAATARAQAPAAGVKLSPERAALVEATEEYKAGTREMIRLKEAEVARAEAAHEELKKLVADGLLARRDLEESDTKLAAHRARLEDLRKQLTESDQMIAEIREAEEAEKQALAAAKQARADAANYARRRLQPTARTSVGRAVIRHAGASGWTLANIGGVQSFFITAFGRPLPTSAFGQTATHDRMGFDHRRAVDVALHPDSAEGRALIGYLQANGIPFIAFRAAVPGSATGPHIHIGPPSHRI
jgi:hypothetical protein